MAELEIHHEEGHDRDPYGQKVGVLAAVLAVGLALVTIVSHRSHTASIMHKSAANDAWAHYQATRVKYHNLELGENLLTAMNAAGPAAQSMRADYAAQKKKYEAQQEEIQQEAKHDEEAAESDERHALRFDIGEGLLEIGLIMSSLYFIAHRKMFPAVGLLAGVAGAGIALTGLLT